MAHFGYCVSQIDAFLRRLCHISHRTDPHGRTVPIAPIGLWGSFVQPQVKYLSVPGVRILLPDLLHTPDGMVAEIGIVAFAFQQSLSNSHCHSSIIRKPALVREQFKIL